MIIKRSQAAPEAFADGKIWDYPMEGGAVGISYQEHHGRVPKKGWGVNTICWEAYYVLSGTAEVYIDGKKDAVGEGDVVILEPNQKSYIIAQNLKLVTITRPDWYSDQYKEIHHQ